VNGDTVNGDTVNGDTVNGDNVNGDTVNGDTVNGDNASSDVRGERLDAPAPAPAQAPVRTARSKGLKESLVDMGRSLGLMAVIMAAVLFATPARGLIFPDRNDRMPPVDYSSQLSGFGQLAHQPALAPTGLPSSWRSNAARLTRPAGGAVALHIGWAVPGERFAGLDEATGDPQRLIANVLGRRGATVLGTVTIGGVLWQLRTSDRGERSLTRTVGAVTAVVTGNARSADLDQLCTSLH
jgi:hypothetical protein